ncbi:hypothetical protein Q031_05855 [Pseudomonas aeruginosa BWHPSA018]|nr:hypothetical protein Q031_05855 [Pseudomonas aeruginosa BWHPSA018]
MDSEHLGLINKGFVNRPTVIVIVSLQKLTNANTFTYKRKRIDARHAIETT